MGAVKLRAWPVALLALACTDRIIAPGEAVPVERVAFAGMGAGDILLDDTVRIHAVGISASGDTLRGRQVSWVSSDPDIIEVSPGGLATARAEGPATITATIEGRSATSVVTGFRLEFAAISAGGQHTCAVTVQGAGWCWGSNSQGELGIGPSEPDESVTPRPVAFYRWQSVRAGQGNTCGVDLAGVARCWGANSTGEVGDGSTTSRFWPAPVSGGHTFSSISSPWGHTCGTTTGGAAYCWGENLFGQLGDGSRQHRLTPAPVVGGFEFFEVSTTSPYFSCGLTIAQEAACWGSNYFGNLGYDTVYYSTSPSPVSGGHSFTQVSGEFDRGCGLDGSGVAWCWGFKRFHHAGKESNIPVAEAASVAFASISEGGEHSCGLTSLGEAWCWGANTEGQLGTGVTGSQNVQYPAAKVAGGHVFTRISAGEYSTCGLTANGEAWCWGANYGGGLGTGSPAISVHTPELVTGGHVFADISTRGPTCALDAAGAAWCWGFGSLGNGSTFSDAPVPVSGGLVFQAVVAGSSGACGLTGVETWCWGGSPTLVPGGHAFSKLAIGSSAICGVDSGGAAWCWGSNYHGALGDGTELPRSVPTAVVGGHSFSDIAAGSYHVCGLTGAGAAYCWGDNYSGQLGNGVRTDSPLPLMVTGGHQFSEVRNGERRACGLALSQDVYCWPTGAGDPHPALLPGGFKFTALTMGYSHSCGLTATGQAYCWGANTSGQLGDGSFLPNGSRRTTPVPVLGGLTFRLLSAGSGHTCGITVQSTAYCWGAATSGQLGSATLGEVGGIPFPVKVRGQR